MKKVRLGLIALAVLGSVGGALANKGNVKAKGTTYYVTGSSGSNYIVTTTAGGSCGMSAAPCTVTSTVNPVNGQIPKNEVTVITTGTYEL